MIFSLYEFLLSLIDRLLNIDINKETIKPQPCKYVFASVFPDEIMMDEALRIVANSKE